MHTHIFKLLIVAFFLGGCAVTPVSPGQSDIDTLSRSLSLLDDSVPDKERVKLARDIFAKTAQLTKEFELTSPPLWHNTLVNIGIRKKGLCYHWSDALYNHLSPQGYEHYDFHLVGAHIGEYWFEHNALVIVKKGEKDIQKGIIIDAWRNSGKLYFSKVEDDEDYTWSHRPERGCRAIR